MSDTYEPEHPSEGPWEVRLEIPAEATATSPRAAVEEFINDIVTYGLRGYLYRVLHTETGEVFYVQEEATYSLAEAMVEFGTGGFGDEDDEEETS